MIERIPTITELPVDQIGMTDRLRDVRPEGVESLIGAIGKNGFVGRIIVRRTKNGDFVLDGAHRLTAMRDLGRDKIPCDVVRCSDDEALMFELDGNLAGANLSTLELAYFLAKRRETFLRINPQAKQGLAGASCRWDATDMMSVAQSIAKERSISERHVYRLMSAGKALSATEYQRLCTAPKPIVIGDLFQIAKITNAAERYHVVDSLAKGKVKNAATARKVWKAEHSGLPQPEKDRVEEAFLNLVDRWERAPEAAQRRFVAEHRDSLLALMEDLDD